MPDRDRDEKGSGRNTPEVAERGQIRAGRSPGGDPADGPRHHKGSQELVPLLAAKRRYVENAMNDGVPAQRPGTSRTCPSKIVLPRNPFSALMAFTVVPYFRAIVHSESPVRTRYAICCTCCADLCDSPAT